MKTYGGVVVYLQAFLTSAPEEGEWSASRPDLFTRGERAPGTQWRGGWVGPRFGLELSPTARLSGNEFTINVINAGL
jgi:hypothetical protein